MGSPIFRGMGVTKNNIYGELPKIGGLEQFAKGLGKNREREFLMGEGGLIPRCTL